MNGSLKRQQPTGSSCKVKPCRSGNNPEYCQASAYRQGHSQQKAAIECGQLTCGDTVVHDAQAMHTNLLSSCLDVLQLVLSLHSYILNLAHRLVNVRNLGLLSCLDTLCCHLQQTYRVQQGLLHFIAHACSASPMPAKQVTLMQLTMIPTSIPLATMTKPTPAPSTPSDKNRSKNNTKDKTIQLASQSLLYICQTHTTSENPYPGIEWLNRLG